MLKIPADVVIESDKRVAGFVKSDPKLSRLLAKAYRRYGVFQAGTMTSWDGVSLTSLTNEVILTKVLSPWYLL